MEKPLLVIANLKMNIETDAARKDYIKKTKDLAKDLKKGQRDALVICPASVYIESFVKGLGSQITVGAQDLHHEMRGSHTGEVSAKMLAVVGAKAVIVGHSERRRAGESVAQLKGKIENALFAGLTPIVCLGYTEAGQEEASVIEQELRFLTSSFTVEEVTRMILAYEPVWAIGTGKVPSSHHIHTMTLVIKKSLTSAYGASAPFPPVIYGGSVTTENIRALCLEAHVAGVLVGGASLDPANLIQMTKIINP